jgi:hypothetical protein
MALINEAEHKIVGTQAFLCLPMIKLPGAIIGAERLDE